eukprot:CAMPEP_0117679692 /NCGR_PEP_ID=MMETSP0804-20121206/17947_1 /TAXON_ID=1074897 /ORGANISM="Tetraselmis astigmatica, Strain CCMP880" /LENGTH=1249 /DNA_ID=CAMNT_0005489125 /DNA_START=485 /DNA_END=4234 /DNA_ORIENTATION=-
MVVGQQECCAHASSVGGAASTTTHPWLQQTRHLGGGPPPVPGPFHHLHTFPPGPQAGSELEGRSWRYPPINIIYQHFHDSIRAELSSLAELAKELEHASEVELIEVLQALKQRYKFMEQVYRYHSSVEDEVVYPALDAKVRNVTLAYTVEHESEEFLFDQLAQLLSTGLSQPASERPQTVRHLLEKMEEIHITVRKHLAKEEEQLFPLLLQLFSHGEQATLVSEFLCSIPLAAVNKVLAWLKPNVPPEEQEELLEQVSLIIHDKLLGQLLAVWLRPTTSSAQGGEEDSGSAISNSARDRVGQMSGATSSDGQVPAADSNPVMLLRHIHSAISSAVKEFAEEAVSLQANGTLQGSQLATLLEQYRFLRAVCTFHSHSENETMLPIVKRVANQQSMVAASCRACEEDHILEAANFDALGRLLADVRSCTRRGGKEAALLAAELCKSAEAVRNSVNAHIEKEEAEVLPVLAEHCSVHEQRLVFWQTIRAMPLRLLERMLPWVASQVSEEQCSQMLHAMRMAGDAVGEPEISRVLVQLLVQWAQRGRLPSTVASGSSPKDAADAEGSQEEARSPKRMRLSDLGLTVGVPSTSWGRATAAAPSVASAAEANAAVPNQADQATAANDSVNPIDHIFQFHKALKREVKHLEKEAQSLSHEVDAGGAVDILVHQLEARFHFLKGIYIAHSEAEDKIVFPALERKEVSRNVSHAYSLDHQKEQEMFAQVDELLRSLKANLNDPAAMVPIASRMRVTCAAVRANLDMHVRAEETELWPLFNEHFSFEEQETIVGSIIGNTGAEVLQTMITWVANETEPEEQAAMMDALRSATRNTRFDKWLASIIDQTTDAPDECTSCGSDVEEAEDAQQAARLVEVAGFLAEASGTTAESAEFRPGWEDIFLINQQQLEGAVRRVSNDPNLDPHRKAYIIQSIMASRFIVAQQQQIRGTSRHGSSSRASTPTSASSPLPSLPMPCDHSAAGEPSRSSMEQPAPKQTHPSPCHSGLMTEALGGAAWPPQTPAGCKHYKRNCALVAPCCNKVYHCRLCHDEVENHKMDRYAVREMVCKICNVRQLAAGSCGSCGHTMARYYCSICHLFDNEPGRDIYHCPSCNVCRRGKGLGIDFFHCMKCNSCMSLSLFEKHTCRERSLEGNCAVCHEYLFDSPTPIKELPCGHFMHSSCFGAYTRYNYTCPICSKSMGDMRVYFQMLDALVASERLPEQYKSRTQNILCNDCCRQGTAPYHFVYHSCQHCGSYNTRIM